MSGTERTPEEEAAAAEFGQFLETQMQTAAMTAKAPAREVEPPPPESMAGPDNVAELPAEGSKAREDWKKKRKGKGKSPPPPRQFKRLPADCPVKPLGLNGDVYHFLDANGQYVDKSAAWLNQIGIDALFSDESSRAWLEENYPRIGEGGRVNGIDREAVRASLMVACGELSKRGKFQARERVREAGAWVDGDRLVLHLGARVIFYEAGAKPRSEPLGIYNRFVYPLSQEQPEPALPADAPDGEGGPAAYVLGLIKTWQHERRELDAAMLLGWIGCALIGGALHWRAAAWIMGASGSGKSHLQRLIRALLGGEEAYIGAEDGSAASTWQRMEKMSLPALFDEVEADADNRKKQAIVELMRQAASGGLIARGGSDHKPLVFRVQSSFLFSSVNPLPLAPQDLTRLCHFELLPFAAGASPPDIDYGEMKEIGRKLRARIIKGWPQWKAHLAPWWDAINAGIGRQGQRMADTFGTLLAMQHMLQFDTIADPSDVAAYLDRLLPYLRQRAEQTGSDSERMLKRLCAKAVKVEDKEVRTEAPLRSLIYIAAGYAGVHNMAVNDPDADMLLPDISAQAARRILSRWGLTVARVRQDDPADVKEGDPLKAGQYVAMAGADHTELSKIFYGTHWQQGGWLTPAKRFEGAGKRKVRFDQKTEWGTLIPIKFVLDAKEGTTEGE